MVDGVDSENSDLPGRPTVRHPKASRLVSSQRTGGFGSTGSSRAGKGFRFQQSIRRLIRFALRRPGEICDLDGMIGHGSMPLNLCAALVGALDFVSDEDGLLTGADLAILGVQPALPSLARVVLKQGRQRLPMSGRDVASSKNFREASVLLLKAEGLGRGELFLKCWAPESGDFGSVRVGGIDPFWLAGENPGRVSQDTILFDLDSIVAFPRFAALEWELRADNGQNDKA